MKKLITAAIALLPLLASPLVRTVEIGLADGDALRSAITEAIGAKIKNDTLVIKLISGRYEFSPSTAERRELYISNHDQVNPKAVGILIENTRNVILDGGGAELLFHGRMLPVALLNSSGCSMRNFSIDFPNPQISQVVVEENDTAAGRVAYRPEPWVDWEVRDSTFIVKGDGWEHTPKTAIAFEEGTRRIVYRTGDLRVGVRKVFVDDKGRVNAPWKDPRLKPGTRVAMRGSGRPAPAIFLNSDTATTLLNIAVRYAEGMGVLAQNCVDVSLDSCAVALRVPEDPRYFTTQADATHFSSCSGTVTVADCLFEGMMDDAVNIHGTYLKITEIIDSATVRGRYMHHQSWGFPWGAPGDTVRFVASATMDTLGAPLAIKAIRPLADNGAPLPSAHGAREFLITLSAPIPSLPIGEDCRVERAAASGSLVRNPALPSLGLENLSRTPAARFARNTVRHNRARGALFSTPRPVVCEDNTFDHTSGAAILLCGDCNGWYETGACRDVTIRRNTFINALTTPYQFTEAVISIYPVIPDIEHQRHPFHSGISITDNRFVTFGTPLLYAKSTSGLRFLRNTLETNTDYPPYHPAATLPITLIACPAAETEPPHPAN